MIADRVRQRTQFVVANSDSYDRLETYYADRFRVLL
jgi:hypothetical protein